MNWRRIAVFVVVLLLATALVGFLFGFLSGFLRQASGSVPSWLPLLQGLGALGTVVVVLAVLGYRQREQVWLHGAVVICGTWLVSFPFNVLLLSQPFANWFLGIIGLLFPGGIGLGLGILVRNLNSPRTQAL